MYSTTLFWLLKAILLVGDGSVKAYDANALRHEIMPVSKCDVNYYASGVTIYEEKYDEGNNMTDMENEKW